MTIDLILVARACRDARVAATISLSLNIRRAARDRADRFAMAKWRILLPLLRAYGADADFTVLMDAARIVGVRHIFELAADLPQWLVDSAASTQMLIDTFNGGGGTVWLRPLASLRKRHVAETRADMALRLLAAA